MIPKNQLNTLFLSFSILKFVFAFIFIITPMLVFGDDDPDLEAIEAELKKKDVSEIKNTEKNTEETKSDSITYSDLTNLAPFSQVTVIQKRFLPKTNRFQANFGANYLTNNPFFQSFGLSARLSFFFTEFIGIEGSYLTINGSPKQVTQDLSDYQRVSTTSLVSPKSYTGLDLVIVPFYGKMTWMDEFIVPFDCYVSLGTGSTQITNGSNASTYHLGIGQSLAISKNTLFRWDLSGNVYSVGIPPIKSSGTSSSSDLVTQKFTDLYLGVGFSFLFPGAKYR